MNNIKYLTLLLLTLVLSTGCSDWLDVNENPNKLNHLTEPEIALPVAQVNIANALMGWDMGITGAYWSQYWTQKPGGQDFKGLDRYDNNSFDIAYRNLVSSTLMDLKMIKASSVPTDLVYFIAEALSIYTWQIVTDTWGDVPYYEALRAEEGILSPKFDSQQTIYTDLIARVNVLLNNTDIEKAGMDASKDFIFNGEVNRWIEFATTLKLKLMLRLSETSGYNNADLLSLVQQDGFISKNAMISGAIWGEYIDSKQHPMVEFEALFAGYLGRNVFGSATFVNWLRSTNDPRIDTFFTPSRYGHSGLLQGDYNSDEASDSAFSSVKFATNSDIPLMSTWEVEFYKAEVYLRANDDANARICYNAGVRASLDYWGYTTADLTGTGASVEWNSGGTFNQRLEQIALQKWTSYCKLQHWESFLERNRLKYPALNMVNVEINRKSVYDNFPVGNLTLSVVGRNKLQQKLPSSLMYPSSEVTRNAKAPANKSDIGQVVWWNKKPENEIQP